MTLPSESSQEPQKLPQEHWDFLPELPMLSGPTMPTLCRRFYKHSPTTLLKLGTDEGEGIMTALAYSVLGSCVPRVTTIVTIPIATSSGSVSNTKQGLILTLRPGTPIVELWPSLTLTQRETIKGNLCRLLVCMRSHHFSYYGRPAQQPYVLFAEVGTETFASCASRAEWDESRISALQQYASTDPERVVHLEKVQRSTTGPAGWDRPVLTHVDLSDRNILVDPETLDVTGFLDWEMANIMPAYFEYVAARLSGGHQPAWRKEALDVLKSVLRCECNAEQRKDLDSVNSNEEGDRYKRTLATWDTIVDVERIAQGYDDDCKWTF